MKDPEGWSQDDISTGLILGYARSGLQNLRPSSAHWSVGMLLDNRVTHSPDVLDPLLRGKKNSYAQGLIVPYQASCQTKI